MSIKNRLILSHIAVFIVPVLMTILIVLIAGVSLMAFAKNGHHIYLESITEYQYISAVVRRIVFHEAGENMSLSRAQKLITLLAPEQNLIILRRGENIVYRYGNASLLQAEKQLMEEKVVKSHLAEQSFSYMHTVKDDFVYIERHVSGNIPCEFCFICKKVQHDADEALDNTVKITIYSVFVSLLLLVVATSWLLSRFVLRRILLPLNHLRNGAEKIWEGNLEVRLEHQEEDEIKPVVDAFNLMTVNLLKSLQEREKQEEGRRELIASISHDLRTPLTAIKAYVEGIIKNVADTPEKQQRYLCIIRSKAEELNRLIEQLLLFSQIECGEKAIPLEKVDLRNVLEAFVAENRFAWDKSGAAVQLNVSDNVEITGNVMLLNRILTNIINNSIKYKTAEYVMCSIHLQKADGCAVISVQDDGPGVPEEFLPNLFEPFYRTDKARSHTEEGSGLGLSIALNAVKIMHGNVSVHNAEPNGLRFVLQFPASNGSGV